ncbi:unnamed protein product [Chironomus riparius]|uniref:Uncharacterized protein n=1 Tax=Chironomus riparius TaxID=315576 RepID=A0A9N9WQ33_9DIPT|nr:unnamed protein product [Chironomus riparius]
MKIAIFIIACATVVLEKSISAENSICTYEYRQHYTKKNPNVFYYTCIYDSYKENNQINLTGRHHKDHNNSCVQNFDSTFGYMQPLSSFICELFQNLKKIRVTISHLESINEDAFQKCKDLRFLMLPNNKIRELSENLFLNQSELEYLNLALNAINFLPSKVFHPLKKLKQLYLNDNKIQSINPEWFRCLQKLTTLSLAFNQISEVPSKSLQSLKNLTTLWIDRNNLKTLKPDSFVGLQNLKLLSLSSNKITDLPVDVFGSLNNLQYLVLNDNKLTTIHSDSFGILNQLIRIDIQNNTITAIDENLINKLAITYLDMRNNPCNSFFLESARDIKSNLTECFVNYQQLKNHSYNLCSTSLE